MIATVSLNEPGFYWIQGALELQPEKAVSQPPRGIVGFLPPRYTSLDVKNYRLSAGAPFVAPRDPVGELVVPPVIHDVTILASPGGYQVLVNNDAYWSFAPTIAPALPPSVFGLGP